MSRRINARDTKNFNRIATLVESLRAKIGSDNPDNASIFSDIDRGEGILARIMSRPIDERDLKNIEQLLMLRENYYYRAYKLDDEGKGKERDEFLRRADRAQELITKLERPLTVDVLEVRDEPDYWEARIEEEIENGRGRRGR